MSTTSIKLPMRPIPVIRPRNIKIYNLLKNFLAYPSLRAQKPGMVIEVKVTEIQPANPIYLVTSENKEAIATGMKVNIMLVIKLILLLFLSISKNSHVNTLSG